jgi:hypothetical protein
MSFRLVLVRMVLAKFVCPFHKTSPYALYIGYTRVPISKDESIHFQIHDPRMPFHFASFSMFIFAKLVSPVVIGQVETLPVLKSILKTEAHSILT